MACLLCKLPAFPSFGIKLGDTNLTCTFFHRRILSNSSSGNQFEKIVVHDQTVCYVSEPGGTFWHAEIHGGIVRERDGPSEPFRSNRVAEASLLEWVGRVQDPQRRFYQGLGMLFLVVVFSLARHYVHSM